MSEVCPLSAIPYVLKKSKRRQRLALQIKDGQLFVLAPDHLDKHSIERFIFIKQDWIKQHLVQQQQRVAPDYLSLQRLPWLDTQLTLRIVKDSHNAVTLEGEVLWLQISHRVSAQNKRILQLKLIRQWYEHQAKLWFSQKVRDWCQQLQVTVSAVHIRHWRQKWGCCRSDGEVSFNWRLMLAPAWVAEYVVVHELVHRHHMNHSPAFWQMLRQAYPQADAAKRWFREHGHLLDWATQ